MINPLGTCTIKVFNLKNFSLPRGVCSCRQLEGRAVPGKPNHAEIFCRIEHVDVNISIICHTPDS